MRQVEKSVEHGLCLDNTAAAVQCQAWKGAGTPQGGGTLAMDLRGGPRPLMIGRSKL